MWADHNQSTPEDTLASDWTHETQRSAAVRAREIYAFRRRRNLKFEGLARFDDPAWDILLAIYIDEADQRQVSISSACLASHVAQTTALRWIVRLEETGVLVREDDPFDGRRANLRLSPIARERMTQLLGK